MFKPSIPPPAVGLQTKIVRIVLAVVGLVVVARLIAPTFDPVRSVRQLFQSKAQSYVEDGNDALDHGHGEIARKFYEQAIQEDPKNPELYTHLAQAAVDLNDYRQAKADLNHALDIDPKYAMAFFLLADIDLNQERPDLALGHIDQAIEADPQFFRAYETRGYLLANAGKFSQALVDYQRALAAIPKDSKPADFYRAHKSIAAMYLNMGMTAEGIKACSDAYDADPNFVGETEQFLAMFGGQIEALDHSGEAYTQYLSLKKRIADFRAAHQSDP